MGIPVRSVNWVRVFPTLDADGRDCLVAVMGQQAAGFTVVKIDPATGAASQATSPDPTANFPTGALRARNGRVYIGAAYAGHLYRYDPATERLDDLGAINPPDDTFPCNMDEDDSGVIWIGCYGSAGLTSYDPAAGSFTRHGRMDGTDMYCYPHVGAGGTIACLIRVTRPHVVVYDPESGLRRNVGPVVVTEDGGSMSQYRAADGQVYIRSTAGDFRLNGFEAEPVDDLPDPAPSPTLSDGSTADFADRDIQMFHRMAITHPGSGKTRTIPVAYESAGSEIFLVHRGPDDNIYGSSILPLHLFRHDPSTGAMDDLGMCTTASGEAYSMANMDGRLYICSYPGAMLSVYDPARPYHFGKDPDSNPRELGRMDEISYRPRSMIAGPLGRVWTASVPNYGMWGGPLSWYDPATERFGTYRDIAGEASCWALAWLDSHGLLAVGTTIDGGTGTQPRVDQASLFLWDCARRKGVGKPASGRGCGGQRAGRRGRRPAMRDGPYRVRILHLRFRSRRPPVCACGSPAGRAGVGRRHPDRSGWRRIRIHDRLLLPFRSRRRRRPYHTRRTGRLPEPRPDVHGQGLLHEETRVEEA